MTFLILLKFKKNCSKRLNITEYETSSKRKYVTDYLNFK